METESYKKLLVWEKSIDLVECIYRYTHSFPEGEKFGLTSQLRRSAVSIPSNIAEGHGRKSDADFARFLRIAYGSSSELETQLLISFRLKLLPQKEYDEVIMKLTEIRKMLNKFISNLNSKD